MKTQEEMNALKEEVESLNKKLAELSDEEMKQIEGGITILIRRGYPAFPDDPDPRPPWQ